MTIGRPERFSETFQVLPPDTLNLKGQGRPFRLSDPATDSNELHIKEPQRMPSLSIIRFFSCACPEPVEGFRGQENQIELLAAKVFIIDAILFHFVA